MTRHTCQDTVESLLSLLGLDLAQATEATLGIALKSWEIAEEDWRLLELDLREQFDRDQKERHEQQARRFAAMNLEEIAAYGAACLR